MQLICSIEMNASRYFLAVLVSDTKSLIPGPAACACCTSPIEMKSKQVEINWEMTRGCLEHEPRGGESGHRGATGPRHQPPQSPANLHERLIPGTSHLTE